MSKTLLVSLVSDQTIPNVQLIKEFENEATDYLFVTTKKKKIQKDWIIDVLSISKDRIIDIQSDDERKYVNEYDINDIQNKLAEISYQAYDNIIVNLTGGTKIMTLAVSDFFKKKEFCAKYYYVKDDGLNYLCTFPIGEAGEFQFKKVHISLKDYLMAYGFEVETHTSTAISQSETIFKKYKPQELVSKYLDSIKLIQTARNKDKKIKAEDFGLVSEYLQTIGYQNNTTELTKEKVKYLSGEWFEEYVYNRIKRDFNLKDDEILQGATITKGEKTLKNSLSAFFANNVEFQAKFEKEKKKKNNIDDTTNEMDVMFIKNSTLYVIECKSSIFSEDTSKNILEETIYKLDSIKKRMGLFAKSYIFFMDDLQAHLDSLEKNQYNIWKSLKSKIQRASYSDITLVNGPMLRNYKSLTEIIKTSDHVD